MNNPQKQVAIGAASGIIAMLAWLATAYLNMTLFAVATWRAWP